MANPALLRSANKIFWIAAGTPLKARTVFLIASSLSILLTAFWRGDLSKEAIHEIDPNYTFCNFTLGIAGTAHADAVPKRSKDFTGNYQTLVKDQQASPQVADCIASAYDYVKKSKKYDRLGFTKDDIAAATTNDKSSKFSAKDTSKVSAVISVPGGPQ